MSSFSEIESAVLRLSEKDRRRLADSLMGSLPLAEAAWEAEEIVAEAVRRDAEIEQGGVKPLSETQFWAGVRPRRA